MVIRSLQPVMVCLFKRSDMAECARHGTITAEVQPPFEFVHDEIAYNYRMINVNAALGRLEIECLEEF